MTHPDKYQPPIDADDAMKPAAESLDSRNRHPHGKDIPLAEGQTVRFDTGDARKGKAKKPGLQLHDKAVVGMTGLALTGAITAEAMDLGPDPVRSGKAAKAAPQPERSAADHKLMEAYLEEQTRQKLAGNE